MLNFVKNFSNGKKCAVVASLFFTSALLGGFPAVIPWAAGTVLALCGFGAAIYVLTQLFDWLEKHSDKLQLAPIILLAAFSLLVLGLLGFISTGIAKMGLNALEGSPVDDYGTMIPVSHWAILVFLISVIVATFCCMKHVFIPMFADEGFGGKAFVVALTLGFGLAIFSLPGGLVYLSYRADNPNFDKAVINRQIETLQKKLDEKTKQLEEATH
jgi:hypothetical protein